jgi:hypothetical protein
MNKRRIELQKASRFPANLSQNKPRERNMFPEVFKNQSFILGSCVRGFWLRPSAISLLWAHNDLLSILLFFLYADCF